MVQTLLNTVSGDQFVYLAFSSDRANLRGLRSGGQIWDRPNLDFWALGDLGGSEIDLTQMIVHQILRQGVDGFGYVAWRHATLSPFGIQRVNTADGNRTAWCRNPGRCDQVVALADGSVIVGGANDDRRCPVLFRWKPESENAPTLSARTTSNGGAHSGLMWERLFTDCPANETVTSPAVESLQYDGGSELVVLVRKPSVNLAAPYRVRGDDGNAAAQITRSVVLAVQIGAGDAHVQLVWNPISEATRYHVYWGTQPGLTPANATKIENITTRSYQHTGRTNGTRYFYVVTAQMPEGESQPSTEVSAVPTGAAPVNQVPTTPSIVSPAANAAAVAVNPTLQGSPFTDANASDTLRRAEWEIYESQTLLETNRIWYGANVPADPRGPTIEVTMGMGQFTRSHLGRSRLSGNTTYYARVRYFDGPRTSSEWSPLQAFTVGAEPNSPPFSPTLLYPGFAHEGVEVNPVLRASPFRDPNAADTLAGADWQIASDVSFTDNSIVWEGQFNATTSAIVDGTHGVFKNGLAGRSALTFNRTWHVRVRYRDSHDGVGPWSAPVAMVSRYDPAKVVTVTLTSAYPCFDLRSLTRQAATAPDGSRYLKVDSFGATSVLLSQDAAERIMWNGIDSYGHNLMPIADFSEWTPPLIGWYNADNRWWNVDQIVPIRLNDGRVYLMQLLTVDAAGQLCTLKARYVGLVPVPTGANERYFAYQHGLTSFYDCEARDFAIYEQPPANRVALYNSFSLSTSHTPGADINHRGMTGIEVPANLTTIPRVGFTDVGSVNASVTAHTNHSSEGFKYYVRYRDTLTCITPVVIAAKPDRSDDAVWRVEEVPLPAVASDEVYLSYYIRGLDFDTLGAVNDRNTAVSHHLFYTAEKFYPGNQQVEYEYQNLGGVDIKTAEVPTSGNWTLHNSGIDATVGHCFIFRNPEDDTRSTLVKPVERGPQDIIVQVRNIN